MSLIQGNIVDDFENPIPNVNVLEVGTGNGTISDSNGNYSLILINDLSAVKFSHVSYQPKTFQNSIPNKVELIFGNTLDEVELIIPQKPKKKTSNKTRNILLTIGVLAVILKK